MRILSLVGSFLFVALPAFCQGEELAKILQRFDRNCQKVSTVNYRSPELVQPGSRRTFFVSGKLQRRPRRDSKLIDRSCFPVKAETLSVSLSFLDRRVNTIPLFRHRSTVSFNYVKPIAFSPDGRFLVLQIDRSNSLDLQSEVDIVDTAGGFLPFHLDICPEATFGETFVGFIDNDRAQFRCLSGKENDREVWHLSRRSREKD